MAQGVANDPSRDGRRKSIAERADARIEFRCSDSLKDQMRAAAGKRSLSVWIVEAIEQRLAQDAQALADLQCDVCSAVVSSDEELTACDCCDALACEDCIEHHELASACVTCQAAWKAQFA